MRSHNHWHQDELKNARNPSNIKYDSPRMTNLENIWKKNNEKRTTMRERERNNTSERMKIKPKKGSWHLFNNCGKIIVNLLFVFSTRGAQLFSSYSLLINESFNYSPKVISFLSSSEEFSLATLVSTFLPLPIVFSFVGGASQTLILDIASK